MGYKCSFCGAEYSQAIDRARCEFACDEKIKQTAEEEKQKKMAEERAARYDECVTVSRQAERLWNDFMKDYGSCSREDEVEKAIAFLKCLVY